ncbi:DUF6283 family protein [Kocuria palustris]|uniref:DUF6283 family protein n=1 Tax=Kocuria palustris TaxID=71999 RepID=UPI00077B7424|nr:DUF6283 family protein [Kocuria palustris]
MADRTTTARKRPCASCPYRCDAPSGIWEAQEYDKLPLYDGEISEQMSARVFMCHQSGEQICSGWLGHRNPHDLLAVRLAIAQDDLDPALLDYSTDIELFDTGAAAAAHGKRDLQHPDHRACSSIQKITAVRSGTDHPITDD